MKKYILSLIAIAGLSAATMAQGLQRDMQFWRSYDQRGINVFETGKADTVEFDGIKVRVGGHFTQQFQSLSHSNAAGSPALIEIGAGTNLATANLNIDVALADGVRLNLVTYLSSRHHPETWVKGGFLQVDKLGFLGIGNTDWFDKYLTVRVGHMEINYGDAHFRRSDNGNAMYNPFIGNYIMDAFTTEVGGEVFYQNNGFLAMVGVTGGEIQGGITRPDDRKLNLLGKVGYDKYVTDDVRVRLTGSIYTTSGSARNTLWGGDRAGSRYYLVMDPVGATTAGNFTSGRLNPGQTDNITAMVFNPFVKIKGLELFGNFEQSKGKAANEQTDRTWNQIGADAVYRIGVKENVYLAARYNKVSGELAGGRDVSIDRVQIGGGWFVTKNILAKLEYVNQNYNDFAVGDIRNGGRFNGLMIEGVIGF
ncbi:hypothetical protein SAMN06295967_106145 [Belliella buryatensis]|uniref:Phosphate-selective porin O and P n=1 Tax=Belliella buryatensis TaxID=1500549 RepID=A0A239D690_9BACT|nr:hypothetical protein [Belliella buryatensis]SNS27895.1 hypothetical protein SAMN06295967_106145 [Belliella buryatensis]